MRYGFMTPNFGALGDANILVDLAGEAEQAGWEGFFLWDHIQVFDIEPNVDPWMALAAMATQTQKLYLGTLVTPLPRRNLAKLARELITLDRMSSGRAIFGVGLGYPDLPEYADFGDETDLRTRAAMVDEGLEVLRELMTGAAVKHRGEHYRIETPGFAPSVQQPVPIWVAGAWPGTKPFRRAARWDGVVPMHQQGMEGKVVEGEDMKQLVEYIDRYRDPTKTFDIVKVGATQDANDTAAVREHAELGATWWIDGVMPDASIDQARERLRAGPPRI